MTRRHHRCVTFLQKINEKTSCFVMPVIVGDKKSIHSLKLFTGNSSTFISVSHMQQCQDYSAKW